MAIARTKAKAKTPVRGSSASAKAKKAAEPTAEPIAEPTAEEIIVGNYRISIEVIEENRAIAYVENTETAAIVLNQVFEPRVLPPVLDLPKVDQSAFMAAKYEAIAAYHAATGGLQDGLADISVLLPHPYNALLYGTKDKEDDALIALLEREDAEVSTLEVDPETGWIRKGNRRYRAAIAVNQKDIAAGKLPRYELVKIECAKYANLEADLFAVARDNQSRTRSVASKLMEGKFLSLDILASKVDCHTKREAIAENSGLGIRNIDAINAINSKKINYSKPVQVIIDRLALGIGGKPQKIENVLSLKSPVIGVDDAAFQEEVLKELDILPSRTGIDAVRQIVASRLVSGMSSGKPDGDGNDNNPGDEVTTEPDPVALAVQRAIALGDNPKDNRNTPRDVVELALKVMGEIDVDAFAMLPNPDYIPAKEAFTIERSFFDSPEKVRGNIFANPPYSITSKCVNVLSQLARAGSIQKLFLIIPLSSLSLKGLNQFISDMGAMLLIPDRRLSFPAGDVLLSADPSANEDSNRDGSVIIFWSTDKSDYAVLAESSPMVGGLVSSPYQAPNPYELLSSITAKAQEWQEVSTGFYSLDSFYGLSLGIRQTETDCWAIAIDGEEDPIALPDLETAKQLAIAKAILSFDF